MSLVVASTSRVVDRSIVAAPSSINRSIVSSSSSIYWTIVATSSGINWCVVAASSSVDWSVVATATLVLTAGLVVASATHVDERSVVSTAAHCVDVYSS